MKGAAGGISTALLVMSMAAVAACGRHARAGGAADSSAAVAQAVGEQEAGPPMDPREAEAWLRAGQGDDGDLARLADLVGCEGLRERAVASQLRPIAIRAMASCRDFSVLPWLAQIAATGEDAEAADALETIVDQAARPRRAVDPEDADDLSEGCRELLALAKAKSRPRVRRVAAIRALRMLADRGCVNRAEVPVEFDAK